MTTSIGPSFSASAFQNMLRYIKPTEGKFLDVAAVSSEWRAQCGYFLHLRIQDHLKTLHSFGLTWSLIAPADSAPIDLETDTPLYTTFSEGVRELQAIEGVASHGPAFAKAVTDCNKYYDHLSQEDLLGQNSISAFGSNHLGTILWLRRLSDEQLHGFLENNLEYARILARDPPSANRILSRLTPQSLGRLLTNCFSASDLWDAPQPGVALKILALPNAAEIPVRDLDVALSYVLGQKGPDRLLALKIRSLMKIKEAAIDLDFLDLPADQVPGEPRN